MVDAPIVLITGATGNLGCVMASSLAKAGFRLVLTARDEKKLKELFSKIGKEPDKCALVAADLGDEVDRQRLIDQARAQFGRMDVIVNNAGVTPDHLWPDHLLKGEPQPWEIGADVYRQFLEVNVICPHELSMAFVSGMVERGWGRIVNISTSLDTMLKRWPYGASKAALEAYTAVLAQRLEGTGVTVNALLPGGLTKAEPIRNESGEIIRQALPPSIMIAPMLWLCSTASDRISGRRIVAARWDTSLSPAAALEKSSDPVAWTGFGARAAHAGSQPAS